MHKHHHCCKCPECYEVTRMAALRRMDAPSYGGEWQAEPYGYPPGYGGGQTLPPPASGGGGSMGGGSGTLGRSKGKIMSGGGPGGPNPKGQSKGGPKVNGNNSGGGQGGWWPECTCTNREWYDQVTRHPYSAREGAVVVGVGVGVRKLMRRAVAAVKTGPFVLKPRPPNSYRVFNPQSLPFLLLLSFFPPLYGNQSPNRTDPVPHTHAHTHIHNVCADTMIMYGPDADD